MLPGISHGVLDEGMGGKVTEENGSLVKFPLYQAI